MLLDVGDDLEVGLLAYRYRCQALGTALVLALGQYLARGGAYQAGQAFQQFVIIEAVPFQANVHRPLVADHGFAEAVLYEAARRVDAERLDPVPLSLFGHLLAGQHLEEPEPGEQGAEQEDGDEGDDVQAAAEKVFPHTRPPNRTVPAPDSDGQPTVFSTARKMSGKRSVL